MKPSHHRDLGRVRVWQRTLTAALLPGLLINPATPLNPQAHALLLVAMDSTGIGGGTSFDWGLDLLGEWADVGAGGEGGWPDNGGDEIGDLSDGLDLGGDSWSDAQDPDAGAPDASDDASAEESNAEDADEDQDDKDQDEKPDDTEGCTATAETAGNPINLGKADKVQYQVDYRGRDFAPLRAARLYHSNRAAYPARVTVPIGVGWRFFYDRSIQALGASQTRLHRYDGSVIDFAYSGSTWATSSRAGSLTTVVGGWQYVNLRNGLETYNSAGQLVAVAHKGRLTTLQYDAAGRLIVVTNPFGRALALAYDAAGRVATIVRPGGGVLGYAYDANGNLASVTFPDSAVRRYAYDNPAYVNALTGIVDETGRRIVTWGYDGTGRPNYNHFGNGINPLSISYGVGQVVTTDARGTVRTRSLAMVGGRQKVAALTVAATLDSAATTTRYGFDSNGYLARTDARSGAANLAVNDARGRPLVVTRANGTAYARTVQHSWHGIYNIAVSTRKSDVTTNRTVDGFGRITQVSRTGTNGVSVSVRQRSYNAQHLLGSVTNARGGTTTFAYDAQGNRTSRTNPAGQTTLYSQFDAHGRPTRIVRPSGAVVTRSYDARGRLVQQAANGVVAAQGFDAAGRPMQVTRADGSWVSRSYDTAGRLAAMSNHRGENVTIGRDVAGKVASRSTYNAAGRLVHAAYARFDRLGRMAATVDSRGHVTQATYAADARRSGGIDALGRVFSGQLDLLNRPTSLTQPNTTAMRQAGGPATVNSQLNWDAGKAAVRSAADSVSVATGFGFDALNRVAAEAGNDGGVRQWSRNAAGDVLSHIDALGATLTVTRDALVRPTQVAAPGVNLITYTYVPGQSGRLLAGMTDPSGTTAWTYDSEGRLLSKSHTSGMVSRMVTLSRDGLGRVSSMAYPSGMRVDLVYAGDTVSSITVNGTRLLGNIGYNAFAGAPANWTWGNGSLYERIYDQDGRVARVSLGSVTRNYGYDATGRVVEYNDVLPSGAAQRSSFSYDEAGQLTGYSGPGGSFSYAYDTNGNRRSQTRNGVTTTQTYTAGSNRLLTSPRGSYSYRADGSPTSDGLWKFGYDAFGRLTIFTGFSNMVMYTRLHDGLGMRVGLVAQEYIVNEPLAATDGSTGVQAIGASTPVHSSIRGAATSRPVSRTTSSMPREEQGVVTAKPNAKATAGASPQRLPGGGGGWVVMDNIRYFHSDAGQLLGEYNLSTGYSQETIWLAGMPVGTMINGVLYTVRADHLGTPRSVARASDNLEVWRWDGEPFGDSRPVNPVPTQTITYNLRFAGQQYEPYTGYYQNWHRDYDPYTGRYIQADPTGLGGGWSRYTYVGGNPISNVDPTGLDAMVCLYPGAGGFGHVGIGINSSSTSGFYPRSNAPGNPVTGTGGIVQRDTKAANQCKTIETTPEQDRQMSEFMKVASQGTLSDYALLTNNCTNFVRDVLLQGGLSIPAASPRPELFFRSLPGTPTRP